MPKGYWVVHVNVDDMETYQNYREAAAAVLPEFGARFLVRAGHHEIPEGSAKPRTVVIEFPSYQAAKDCYYSEKYASAKAIRQAVAQSDLVIIEGGEG